MKRFYVLSGSYAVEPQAFLSQEELQEAYRQRPRMDGGMAYHYEWIEANYGLDLQPIKSLLVREISPLQSGYEVVGAAVAAHTEKEALTLFDKWLGKSV